MKLADLPKVRMHEEQIKEAHKMLMSVGLFTTATHLKAAIQGMHEEFLQHLEEHAKGEKLK